jgi:hypothetical protein
MKGKRRRKLAAAKARKKTAEYKAGGGKSRYARKARFLAAQGGWGWQYPDKPWR